jgi:competence protein ComEA
MYVDVAGAVRQPGVYRLARGARVVDAVREAGGAEADAELDAVNLAMALDDGVRIYVPRRGEADPMGTSDSATVTVHINTATAQQLDALPGVGPATAAAIVAYRTAHGPFSALDELAAVKGIGPAKLDAIRQMIEL